VPIPVCLAVSASLWAVGDGMNGRQLAEIGRQYRPELKVLFITGYAEHAAVRGGFLDPGMQMITKPFTFDLLTAKVREMIRQ